MNSCGYFLEIGTVFEGFDSAFNHYVNRVNSSCINSTFLQNCENLVFRGFFSNRILLIGQILYRFF